jgi:3-oxoacyl-[acyl-carrier protein] reductase
MIDTGLNGKVALVTGANHGMGAATAVALAREGVRVFATYLRLLPGDYGGPDEKDTARATEPGRAYYSRILMKTADDVVRSIRESRGEGVAWEMDLANPENIPALFDKAEEKLGPVEILVNNAAFDRCDTFIPPDELKKNPMFVDEYPMTPITAGTHDEHFAVNSRATVLMMKEFAGRHVARKAQWGRIINMSTDGAYAHPSNVSYGASKLAMESYSRAAAFELGPYGITVNVISPGAVQTGWMPQELTKQLEQSYPLRRVGEPEDIANVVVFFASKQADWITGQVLHVGGGNRM